MMDKKSRMMARLLIGSWIMLLILEIALMCDGSMWRIIEP
jgi:hypothetical protein